MLDPERQNRLGNTLSLSFPDFPSIKTPPLHARLHQETGKHDQLVMYYPVVSAQFARAFSTGVPMVFQWTNGKAKGKFVGYVTHVSYPTVQKLERGIYIHCVAASYLLKERESKIWKNKSASEIVVEVAKKHKLKPVVTPHAVKYSQQSLSGHSYWEKINELAHRVGYVTQVIGTELHFHPLDKMIDQFMTSIPVMAFRDPMTHFFNAESSPTLDMFQPKLGDHIESQTNLRTNKIVSGVDPVTAKIYSSKSDPNKAGKSLRTSTKSPVFDEVSTTSVTASKAMAKSVSSGKALLSRLSIPARGVGQGDPRVAPYRTIEIRGTDPTTDGYWVVTKAEHFIHRDGRYQVEFECATDGLQKNKVTATRKASAGNVPTVAVEMEGDAISLKPTESVLSATADMVKQSENGFTLVPRQWIGS